MTPPKHSKYSSLGRSDVADLLYKNLHYTITTSDHIAKGSHRPVFTGAELNELADFVVTLINKEKAKAELAGRIEGLKDIGMGAGEYHYPETEEYCVPLRHIIERQRELEAQLASEGKSE